MNTPEEIQTPRSAIYIEYLEDWAIACGTMTDKHDTIQDIATHISTLERETIQLKKELEEAQAKARSHELEIDEVRHYYRTLASDWQKMADSAVRVLRMHDQSQLSITIPDWLNMKERTINAYQTLKQDQQP